MKNDWLLGFAAALASVKRDHDQDGCVRDAMAGNGITLLQLVKAGVERFDAEAILRAIDGDSPAERTARGATARHLRRLIDRGGNSEMTPRSVLIRTPPSVGPHYAGARHP